MIEEKVCENWLDVHKHLYQDSWDPELGRHRSPYVFRGLTNTEFNLHTTLQRMGGPFEKLETPLIRNFSKYAYEHVAATSPGLIFTPRGNSIWNWLVLARHHGLPTRLLDWTYSPYVALHFATAELHFQQCPADSVIWCVDYQKTHKLLPNWLKSVLKSTVSDLFTVDMLIQVAQDITEFDKKAAKQRLPGNSSDFVIFFEPPSLDARVVNQLALHSMMSSPTAILDEWLEQHSELCHKVIIPAKLKWEVRDKLDQANINERTLYPGLDGLCMWLRRYYGPRTSSNT
jgi:hypothetical protein